MFYLRCLMAITKNWRHQAREYWFQSHNPDYCNTSTSLLYNDYWWKKEKNSQRKKGLLRRIAVHAKPDIFYKVFRHIIIRQSAHSFAAYLLTAMMRRWRNRPLHKLTRSHEYITLFSIQIWNGREYEGQVQKICSEDETIGTLRSNDADDNENVKKNNRFN